MSEECELIEQLKEHLEAQMEYMPNPEKAEDVELAIDLLSELFGSENVEVTDVLGEVGTLALSVELKSMNIRGRKEMHYFSCITSMADEILIQNNGDKVMMDLFFENAYIKKGATKFTLM